MEFIVEHGSGWDGGRQEFDACANFIQDVFPEAKITEKVGRSMTVTVFVVQNGKPVQIVSVPQRDLFRKYNWPAKGKIEAALHALEESSS